MGARMSHTFTVKTDRGVYEYPVVQFRLRVDQEPVAAAVEEMERLGLTPAAYVKWLLSLRFGKYRK